MLNASDFSKTRAIGSVVLSLHPMEMQVFLGIVGLCTLVVLSPCLGFFLNCDLTVSYGCLS